MIELKVDEGKTDRFGINQDTADKLNAAEGSILKAKNPINQKVIAGIADIDEDVGEGEIKIARPKFEAIGLDAGFELNVERYGSEPVEITEVEFGVEKVSQSEEDPLSVIKKNESDFLDFIEDKIFTKHTEFLWEEKELSISIKETFPELNGEDVADFSSMEEFSYSWGGSDLKSFDGVLLIDISGSMENEDLKMEEIDWVIERINKSVGGSLTTEFLEKIKNKDKIKRSQGAILCALIYFVQKIGRGVGEKISVIPFSNNASVVEFEGNRYFSSQFGDTENASEKIIDDIRYSPKGQTNISSGLMESIDTIKEFEREKMKMIVLLTDGKPHPPSLDDSGKVLNIVENRLAPRRDVIINTIGLGEEVDHHLLDEIAKKTGGEYSYVNSLQGLTEAYSRYATSISIKGTSFID